MNGKSLVSNRVLLIFGLPVATVYGVWLYYFYSAHLWHLFETGWFMTLTMIFGSFIAGASSEGGGAIAYPVMTLILDIDPSVARNFSLVIQSVGMSAAALWILAKRIPIEKTYLWLVTAGGVAGIVLGSYGVAPFLPPVYAKMTFVSFWLSYGLALFTINHVRQRTSVVALPTLDIRQKGELLMIGVLGGILTSVLGNGIDICSFAFVTLKYRLSEKIATPTSVILMAVNAIVGSLLHGFVIGDLQPEALNYWLVSIPVVVVGAPVGAWVISKTNRHHIAVLLYVIIVVQFVGALVVIRPDPNLLYYSAGVFLTGMILFLGLARNGIQTEDSTVKQ